MACQARSSAAQVGEPTAVIATEEGGHADGGVSPASMRWNKGKRRAVERGTDEASNGSTSGGRREREKGPQDGALRDGIKSKPVSPLSLYVALTNLAESSPSATFPPPATAPLPAPPSFRLPDDPEPSSSALTTSAATPAQPLDASASPSSRSRSNSRRRSRLFSFKERITSSRSAPPLEPASTEDAPTSGPKQRRRFSRSLPSLTPRSHDQQQLVGPPATVAVTATPSASKWRDKGKGKLRQLLNPTAASSTSASASRTTGPRLQLEIPVTPPEPVRSPSRTRAYSEPLLRTLDSSAIDPSLTASPDQLAPDPLPVLSAYCTAVSSPTDGAFPFSALEAQPEAEATPEPDRFEALPREVQLRVFGALLEVFREDWRREVCEGTWTGDKARERWSEGDARGRRELLKVGRVSRLWRSLSLDGQLWPTAPASSLLGADVLQPDAITSLFEHSGTFVRELDAKGLGGMLDWLMVEKLVNAAKGFELGGGMTRFTKIDLTGCTSLTSASLASLLFSSPQLVDLTLLGLRVVTLTHMAALGTACPHLARLDVSRCPNLAASGLLRLPYPPKRRPSSSASESPAPRGLRTLRASALSGMCDSVLVELLDRYPALETLDLSFSARITQFGLKRAVAPALESTTTTQTSSTLRQSTRRTSSSRPSQSAFSSALSAALTALLPTAPTKRVYPSLRHLNLSACPLLDYSALAHLAGTLPNLEILEIARFTAGGGRTDGLVTLLSTTPRFRKLDLEDADEATDDVLHALVQHAPELTHLLVSSCAAITDAAFTAAVADCKKLRVLEADGTAISDSTAKTFVELAKKRALKAQREAATKHEAHDPLVKTKYPAVLSVLDNRQTGRRLSRDVGAATVRPRNGQRGHWTQAVGFYHDGEDPASDASAGGRSWTGRKKSALDETDEQRVVVRSFYSSLAVDAATALRDSLAAKKDASGLKGKRSGLLRSRAMSDSEVLRLANDPEGRGCIIS